MECLATAFVLLRSVQLSTGFVSETEYTIGGKTYVERVEQPWFRVPHSEHEKVLGFKTRSCYLWKIHIVQVEVSEVDSSSFGKHFVPEDDVFVSPDWTPHEEKYLPCLDRRCVCPYFNGMLLKGICWPS